MIVVLILFALAVGGYVGWHAQEIAQRVAKVSIADKRQIHAGAGAVAAGITAWTLGTNWIFWPWLVLVLAGVVLSFIDLEHHRLPDLIVIPLYPIMLALLIIPAYFAGNSGLYIRAIVAGVVTFGVYFILALINPAGMGFGDVKFAGVLGLALGFLGWIYVFVGFLAAFVLASVVSLGLIAAKKADRKTRIAFGPFMVAGALVTLIIGRIIAG